MPNKPEQQTEANCPLLEGQPFTLGCTMMVVDAKGADLEENCISKKAKQTIPNGQNFIEIEVVGMKKHYYAKVTGLVTDIWLKNWGIKDLKGYGEAKISQELAQKYSKR